MLIGTAVTRLDVPGEPGEWVEIRRLNHKTLAKAAQAKADAGIASMKHIGAELLAAIRQARAEDAPKADAPAAPVINVDAYDRDLVLQGGVMRWSYGIVSEAALADLDEVTAKWLATEIVTRSLAGPTPEQLGEGTAPSTRS